MKTGDSPLITSLTLATSHLLCAMGGMLSLPILHLIPTMTILGRDISPVLEMRKLGLREVQRQARGQPGQAPSLHPMSSVSLKAVNSSPSIENKNKFLEVICYAVWLESNFFKKISCHLLLFSFIIQSLGPQILI